MILFAKILYLGNNEEHVKINISNDRKRKVRLLSDIKIKVEVDEEDKL